MPVFPLAALPVLDFTAGSRGFGASRSNGRKHAGCDLIAPKGTAIYAVDDGTVLQRRGDLLDPTSYLQSWELPTVVAAS